MQKTDWIYKPEPAAEQLAYMRLSQPAAEERAVSWYSKVMCLDPFWHLLAREQAWQVPYTQKMCN